jgi:hypothetical protein
MPNYQKKYLKYKSKYIELKNHNHNSNNLENDNNIFIKKIIYSFFI